MQPRQPGLPKLPAGVLHAAAIGCAVACAGLAYVVASPPIESWRTRLDTQIAQTRGSLKQGADLRRRHADLNDQHGRLLARVEEVNRRVPDEPREAEFLADLNRLADQHGVRIRDFRRGTTSETPTHSQVAVSITANATHAALCALCEGVAKLPRIAELTKLTVAEERTLGEDYPIEMTYTLYYGLATGADPR